VTMVTRSLTMEPSDSVNLERFIAGYGHARAFYLVPAIGLTHGDFFPDLAILKTRIRIKSADEVAPHDIESIALRIRGMRNAS
jgi:hypothetical protein